MKSHCHHGIESQRDIKDNPIKKNFFLNRTSTISPKGENTFISIY